MPTLNEWVVKTHGLAKEAGWWIDKEQELQDTKTIRPEAKIALHMLMVSEVAEATEAVRDKKPYWYYQHMLDKNQIVDPSHNDWSLHIDGKAKPEGELIELADVVIRIMDYVGGMGWDLESAIYAKHEYNKTRAFRHGGKAL